MKIVEFVWPQDRIDHIAEHGVTPEEVEEVCFGKPLVLRGKSRGENPVSEDPPFRRFRLNGFFSRPQVQKANRNSIYVFVNGRLIRDRLVLHALSSAYYNLMPPSAYPFALLFLE